MPDIKLRDGSGVEQTYTGVDTITVPLADGSGNFTYGLTDEELIITKGNYLFANTSPLYKNCLSYINRANFDKVDGMLYMFYNNSKVGDLSNITIKLYESVSIQGAFGNCINLRKLPNFVTTVGTFNSNQYFGAFENCYKLEQEEFNKFMKLDFSNTPQSYACQNNYNLKHIDLTQAVNGFIPWGEIYWSFQRLIGSEPNLRTIKLPAWNPKQDSKPFEASSYYFDTWDGMTMLDSIIFSTEENGVATKAKIKNGLIYIKNNYGCGSTMTGLMSYPDEPLTKDDNVFKDITGSTCTVERIKAGYERVKNRPNWCSVYDYSMSYQGKTIYPRILTSRFNHKSMVDLINTLPDTSEYIAAKGGTNTLKLCRYMGDLTDEGGTSNLTEEEIAVATAKGWTVTFV